MQIIYVYLIDIISTLGLLCSFFYIFKKAINYSTTIKNISYSITWCLVLSILYTTILSKSIIHIIWLIYCVVSIVFILLITKIRIDTIISAFLLSFAIGYILGYIASFIIGLIFMPFASSGYISGSMINHNTSFDLIFYSLISIVQLILAILLFRIKRFKKGFPFLLKGYTIIISLIFAGIVLIFVTWIKILTTSDDVYTAYQYFISILIIGIGVFIWIRRGIILFYKYKMNERNIELLEQELSNKEKEIQRLLKQNNALRVANHKINHRLSSIECSVSNLIEQVKNRDYSMEISKELSVTLEDIKRLSFEYQEDVKTIKIKKTLSFTKIKSLDDLFSYFLEQCNKNKIEFNLRLNGSIHYMIENIIALNELETMIGDHLQDAIIAINTSNNVFRNILATLGLVEDCYAFTIFDSGIPFEIDTLVCLGTSYFTTHADTGGSGIGFMTTFETMKKYNASLIICEKKPCNYDYSKSITIRFDGKNQYIIESFRADEFPKSDRYIIVKNKIFNNKQETFVKT